MHDMCLDWRKLALSVGLNFSPEKALPKTKQTFQVTSLSG